MEDFPLKRKNMAIVLCTIGALSMNGCMGLAQVTDKEMDIIAEYAADTLLNHVVDYEGLLNAIEQEKAILLSATPTPRPTATPTPTPESSGEQTGTAQGFVTPTSVIDNTEFNAEQLNQVINQEGCSFTYIGYKVANVYEDKSGILPISAEEGKTLYILYFDIKNETNQKIHINMLENVDNITFDYSLHLNGNKVVKPSFYIAQEHLTFLELELEAGKTEQAILVFEVEQKLNVEKAYLTVLRTEKEKGDTSVIIKVK